MLTSSVAHHLAAELGRCGALSGRALVAVSGGLDSVALLRGLLEARDAIPLDILVAHFNHRLRGHAADEDAAWVQGLATRLGVACEIGVALRSTARPNGHIPEEAARQARYEFLRQTAAGHRCQYLLTAHTADDQVETVLHHLFRGTGLVGLQGIPAERVLPGGLTLLRPMLALRRSELELYLRDLRQDYRSDESNANLEMTRNWLRHRALPVLRERFPHVDDAVLRLARQAGEATDAIRRVSEELLQRTVVDDHQDGVRLDVSQLTGQSRHAVREMFVRLWEHRDWPRQEMGYDRWNELTDLVYGAEGTRLLPGVIEARRSGMLLVLRVRP